MNKIKVEKYWAEWCQPCSYVTPIINELRNEYTPKGVSFSSVNLDEQPDLATQNGVRSIPTVIIFRNGKEFGRFTGLQPLKEYKKGIEGAINT
jgi:thioredoxin 1